MGDKFFSQVLYGVETTHGTAVPATKRLVGSISAGPINKDRTHRKIEEDIGRRSAGYRKTVDIYDLRRTLSIPNGYFQAIPVLGGCSLKGGITPVEQTTGQGDYLWDFTPDMDFGNSNDPDSLTIESGDNTQAFEYEYVMFERLRFSAQIPQGGDSAAVQIQAESFGRQWKTAAFTTGIALPTVTSLNAKLSRLYLDNSWANLGNTELPGILRGFDVDILTGLHPTWSGSGDKFFTGYEEGIIGAMLTLTLEGKSAADALWDLYHNDDQATQFLRLALTGPQIGTGENHALIFNCAGSWDEVIPLGGEDRGNNLHTAVFGSLFDPTSGHEFGMQVITNTNTY